jgi:UDP-GlcNAc:undecaprenyl-phosphate/decaprenyl-phosphate GlcNAc-1-phosphate transferase
VTPEALDKLPLILAGGLIAAIVSFLLTPLAIRLAPRIRAIDHPNDDRRIHQQPIPRTGGLAVVAAFVGVGLLGLAANELLHFGPPLKAVRWPQVVALFAGVGVGAIIGFLDDRLALRARWQLLGQLVLAAIALAAGIQIDSIVNPLGGSAFRIGGVAVVDIAGMTLDLGLAVVMTVWVVGMINSVNFVDGLDGLLAGIAIIAAFTLGAISLLSEPIQPAVALLCALLAGSLLGFLPWNFHPARVFIGTAGVFAVGYALAVLSVLGTAKVAVALLVLGVPIIDTFWVITRRLASRRAPFSADRGHFHHRLLDLGLSHRGAVLLVYGLCAVLALLSLVLTGRGQVSAFVVIVIGSGLALYLMTRAAREALEPESYPDAAPDPALDELRPVDREASRISARAAESGKGRP